MKKYLWLADLMAQTVFSVCFTLLFGPKKSLGLERFSLRRHK